ncbi:MAG: substrate-binding domain-containing protein [Spirochaetes bacterium]|nr:substrate-binding domain-containing protein [Spirochaetota bacterium]
MKKFLIIFLILTVALIYSQTDNRIVIQGTGANQDLLREIAEQFMVINKNIKVEVPDSIGSSGGIKGVIDGKIEIARVSRALKEKEKVEGIKYRKFALCPIVFATNPSVTIKNLNINDIINIYRGKIKNWKKLGGPDLEVAVIGREEGDSSRSTIEEVYPEFQTIKYSDKVTILVRDQDMIRDLKLKKGAIGFGALVNMKNSKLNVLSVNNLKPDTKKYNIMNAFAFVYFEKKISYNAKKFLDFVYSQKGIEIIKSNYCEPVNQ